MARPRGNARPPLSVLGALVFWGCCACSQPTNTAPPSSALGARREALNPGDGGPGTIAIDVLPAQPPQISGRPPPLAVPVGTVPGGIASAGQSLPSPPPVGPPANVDPVTHRPP
jgi:hypothetical protein